MITLCLFGCDKQKRDSLALKIQPDSSTKKELIEAAEHVNASCPIKAGRYDILEGAKFEDTKWTYIYTVKEDSLITFDNEAFNANLKAGLKEFTRKKILSGSSTKTMIEALIKVKADLVYKFHGDRTGATIEVLYTYPELRVMMDMMNNK